MDKDRKALLIRMSSDLHKKLKIQAIQEDKNMTEIVLRLIDEYLKKQEKE